MPGGASAVRTESLVSGGSAGVGSNPNKESLVGFGLTANVPPLTSYPGGVPLGGIPGGVGPDQALNRETSEPGPSGWKPFQQPANHPPPHLFQQLPDFSSPYSSLPREAEQQNFQVLLNQMQQLNLPSSSGPIANPYASFAIPSAFGSLGQLTTPGVAHLGAAGGGGVGSNAPQQQHQGAAAATSMVSPSGTLSPIWQQPYGRALDQYSLTLLRSQLEQSQQSAQVGLLDKQ